MNTKAVPTFKVYDVEALIPLLRIRRRTLRRLCNTGVIAARKCGGRWLICEESLRDYLMGTSRQGVVNRKAGRNRSETGGQTQNEPQSRREVETPQV